MNQTVKFVDFDPSDNRFTVRLPPLNRRSQLGKQYIKAYMCKSSVDWPMDQIEIKQDMCTYSCWTVRFNKKSAEHAVMFKMLLD